MSDLVLASYVKSTTALRQLADTLAARRERGADALEYVGMVVLAAIIVAGLFSVVEGLGVKDAFTSAVAKIIGGTAG